VEGRERRSVERGKNRGREEMIREIERAKIRGWVREHS
jgi:hypothetical protein